MFVLRKTKIFLVFLTILLAGYFLVAPGFVSADSIGGNSSASIEEALTGECGFTNLDVCVLWIVYWLVLWPSFLIVGLAANILDFFLGYSLNSNSYKAPFIEQGWSLIRDIANVAFIFTLLFIAIKHILGESAKKALPTLLAVALLMNFSLFFTRVVIDAGNILARAFYNSIVIENDPNYEAGSGYKSITAGLVDKINPQRLLTESMFAMSNNGAGIGEYSSVTNDYTNVRPSLKGNIGKNMTLFLLLAFVNLTLAWTFVSVALLFIGRVIGLWFSMIFSPIAFITLAVPGSGSFLQQLSFDKWKDQTLKLAFVAPVFIFFLYLTITFLDIIFQTGVPSESTDIFMKMMGIFIPFIFVVVLLRVAKKVAEDMAGQFGSAVKGLVGKVAGVAGGIALGGAALVGRKVVGGFATAQLKGRNYEKRIADAQAVGNTGEARRLMRAQKSLLKLQDSSFDIRNAGKAKGFAGKIGKAGGWLAGQGMTGFGGKDFNVGKGSDMSRKKYEDEAEKEKLKRAEEVSKIQFNERASVEDDVRRKANQEKTELEGTRRRRMEEKEQEIDDVYNNSNLTDDEKLQRVEDLQEQQRDINKSIDKLIKKLDEDIKNPIKAEEKRRRNLYADDVEKQNWYNFRTEGNASRTADRIRRGDKAEDDKDKVWNAIQKAAKEKKDGDEDTSSSTPPSGGGNNPPPGGGNNPPPTGGGNNPPPGGGANTP